MLCRKFELIPIKFGFFYKFLVTQKSGQRPCTIYSTWSRPNFGKNSLERLLHFYNFLMDIHVLMLYRKFEQIPIKIGFFTNF